MNFELVPPIGMGCLRIGMPREAADSALDSLRDRRELAAADRAGQHISGPAA
ncbi:hypothetical protein [Streptomyces sp. NPDC051561]|uniref:hypothetical protein n=1 Tax=Streptomyces sp. NPDC051561 TaxID=3365658 RepID=UPI003792AFAD